MSFVFDGRNIGVAVERVTESAAGIVHTTSVYAAPIWVIVVIIAVMVLPILISRKRTKDSD